MWQSQVGKGRVSALAFAPDASTLYTGDAGGWVMAWDRAGGQSRRLFQTKGRLGNDVLRLIPSPDGQLLLAGGIGGFAVWDLAAGERWPSFGEVGHAFALSPDGRTLAGGAEPGRVTFWDLATRTESGKQVFTQSFTANLIDIAYAADGTLALLDLEGLLWLLGPGSRPPHCLTAEGDKLAVSLSGQGLDFSPDGATLAVGSGRSILIWDVPGRKLRRTIPAGRADVRRLAFLPDRSGVAAAGDTPTVTIWDPESGRAVTKFDWGVGKISSLAVAPDGVTAAAGGTSRKFVVWDLDG